MSGNAFDLWLRAAVHCGSAVRFSHMTDEDRRANLNVSFGKVSKAIQIYELGSESQGQLVRGSACRSFLDLTGEKKFLCCLDL